MKKSQNLGTKSTFMSKRKNKIIILMAFYISYETNVKFFLNSSLTISLGVLLNKTFFFLKCFMIWLMKDFELKKIKLRTVLHAGLRSSTIAFPTIWKYRQKRTCF